MVPPEGQNIEIELGDGAQSRRTWRAGSTNECRLCHNAGSGVVLGFNARQLDTLQQLDELTTAGLFAANPSYDGNTLVSPHDASASLNDRGRSYLHMNCGICHNKQGPATVSFFAHRDYDFKELRITKKPGVGNFGIADAQLVKPGAPYSSVILYRLAKLGYGRMPYVGSRGVDGRGINLMEQWIASLSDTHPPTPDTSDPETALQTTEGALALVTKLASRKSRSRRLGHNSSSCQQTPFGYSRPVGNTSFPNPNDAVLWGKIQIRRMCSVWPATKSEAN